MYYNDDIDLILSSNDWSITMRANVVVFKMYDSEVVEQEMCYNQSDVMNTVSCMCKRFNIEYDETDVESAMLDEGGFIASNDTLAICIENID